jgi:hypothetical protein
MDLIARYITIRKGKTMIRDPYNTAPNFANTPPNPPRRNRTLWILVTCIVVLVIAIGTLITLLSLGVFSTPASSHNGTNTQPTATSASGTTPTTGATTPTANPSGGSVTPQQAVTAVSQYYTHINAKDYQDAYNMWGSSYQSSTSYAAFAQGFNTTQQVAAQTGNATALSDGSVKVPVTVTATDTDVASTTTNTYQGYYIVGQEQGNTKLLSANLQLTASSNTRVKQATALLNQYYTFINAKDYQDAYNLWGTAYHNSTSYEQFKAGFATTQSVSIAILPGASVLNEGSVKVPLTIHSVNSAHSGPATAHTYQGYYIIGTEGSTWQLFSASIQ